MFGLQTFKHIRGNSHNVSPDATVETAAGT